jgi:hypothetical protein
MQKWKKAQSLLIVISLGIGGLVGFLLIGMAGQLGIATLNKIINWFMVITLFFVVICLIIDLNKVNRAREICGPLIYGFINKRQKKQQMASILIGLVSIFEVVIFIISHQFLTLILGVMVLSLAAMFVWRNMQKNGLSENGILLWGAYFPWDMVKSYTIEGNTMEITVYSKLFGKFYDNKIWAVFRDDFHQAMEFFKAKISTEST